MEGNATCEAEGNRICLKTGELEECGNCMNGFLEIGNSTNCTFIDDFDFQIILDLIDTYLPQLTSNATNEERLVRLKVLAKVVSFFRSRIPPLPSDSD